MREPRNLACFPVLLLEGFQRLPGLQPTKELGPDCRVRRTGTDWIIMTQCTETAPYPPTPARAPYRPPFTRLVNPPLVTGPAGSAGGASPHASFASFQSGTVGSGQRRAPTTAPRTGMAATERSPSFQMSAGS